jgi:hypothetical protein
MLFIAAALLFFVGLMHGLLGAKNVILPLLTREDFPVVLGNQRNGRLTVRMACRDVVLVGASLHFVADGC